MFVTIKTMALALACTIFLGFAPVWCDSCGEMWRVGETTICDACGSDVCGPCAAWYDGAGCYACGE